VLVLVTMDLVEKATHSQRMWRVTRALPPL
jgi:hypothetical protein